MSTVAKSRKKKTQTIMGKSLSGTGDHKPLVGLAKDGEMYIVALSCLTTAKTSVLFRHSITKEKGKRRVRTDFCISDESMQNLIKLYESFKPQKIVMKYEVKVTPWWKKLLRLMKEPGNWIQVSETKDINLPNVSGTSTWTWGEKSPLVVSKSQDAFK